MSFPMRGAVGGFLHAHPVRVRASHAVLAVGYASTMVLASPVGYLVMGVMYLATVGFEVRESRHVKPAHLGLAVAYVVTGALYPVGVTVVGAAYAFSILAEPDARR